MEYFHHNAGSGSEYGPAYIVDNDVLLVSFNYRLGPLGFLSTGDLASPGNYGLHDQALALKWVHDNIEQFGGDKTRITIMGQSAGGVSAHIHMLNNKTANLFQNGVSLSGSAFGFWPIVQKKRMQGFTRRLAKYLRCPPDDSTKLIECLRGIRPNYIVAASLHFFVRIITRCSPYFAYMPKIHTIHLFMLCRNGYHSIHLLYSHL